MTTAICGKNCQTCAFREPLSCPGCGQGPGREGPEQCQIARCCGIREGESCAVCEHSALCEKWQGRERVPEERLARRAEEQERQQRVHLQYGRLGKWLWLLFWLVVPQLVAGLMSDETVTRYFPALNLPGQILSGLCTVAYGAIVLQLSRESGHYRTSGRCFLLAGAIGVLTAVLTGGREVEALALVDLAAASAALMGEYQEYSGHAQVLQGVDSALAGKWRILWKWYMGVFVALLGSLVVALIAPALGLLVLLAAAVGTAVVCILKLAYLYRTARRFRQLAVSDRWD